MVLGGRACHVVFQPALSTMAEEGRERGKLTMPSSVGIAKNIITQLAGLATVWSVLGGAYISSPLAADKHRHGFHALSFLFVMCYHISLWAKSAAGQQKPGQQKPVPRALD